MQRRAPPTSRARIAGGANPAFAVPHRPGRQAHVCAPHVDEGESRANLARAAPLQDGRQTAAARRKRFIRFSPSRTKWPPVPSVRQCQASAPHQLPSQPGRKAYESCNEGPLPEPTPPAADRSLVGGAGQGGSGVMRRSGEAIASTDSCIGRGEERRRGQYDEGKGKSLGAPPAGRAILHVHICVLTYVNICYNCRGLQALDLHRSLGVDEECPWTRAFRVVIKRHYLCLREITFHAHPKPQSTRAHQNVNRSRPVHRTPGRT